MTDRYFTYVNTLKQVVIIRQDSNYYMHNDKKVANCTSFVKGEHKVVQGRLRLTQGEIECRKEITLDEVYHVVAHKELT